MPTYLTVLDVIAIHERVMRVGGFSPRPLLRPEILESALYRSQQAAYYEGADVIRQAAILAIAISEAQGFEDGNKTTAFACLEVFLRENGALLYSGQRAVADILIHIAMDRAGRDEATANLESLLRENSRPYPEESSDTT